MIVKENRTLLGARDLTHIRMTCGTCGTVVATQIDAETHPATSCPSCREEWFRDYPDRRSYVMLLLQALRYARNAPNGSFKLQLETLDDSD